MSTFGLWFWAREWGLPVVLRQCIVIVLSLSVLAALPVLAQETPSGDTPTSSSSVRAKPLGEGDPEPDSNPKAPETSTDPKGSTESGADAPKTPPTNGDAVPPPPDGTEKRKDLDSTPISRPEKREGGDTLAPVSNPTEALVKVLLGLGILVILFVAVVWYLRRNPRTRRFFGSGPIKVLSRAYIAPRQGVFLVKVGDRVLLLGQGPEGLRTLMEVSEPSEVARLLAQVEESNPQSMTSTFRQALTKAGSDRPATESRPAPARVASEPLPAGDGAVAVDPGYSAQLKLAALRAQLDKTKAGTP